MAKYAPTIMRALKSIQEDDPSGWKDEPRTADYVEHRRDSIARFGEGVWEIYSRGGWSDSSEV